MFARGHFCCAAPLTYFAGRPTSDAGENEKTAQHVPRGTFAENHEAERFSACRPDSAAESCLPVRGMGGRPFRMICAGTSWRILTRCIPDRRLFMIRFRRGSRLLKKSDMFHVKPF